MPDYLLAYLCFFSLGSEGTPAPTKLDLHGFFSRNCLCLAIGALTSYSRHLRGLAKAVIARFRELSAEWKPTKMPNVPVGLAIMKQFPERVQV